MAQANPSKLEAKLIAPCGMNYAYACSFNAPNENAPDAGERTRTNLKAAKHASSAGALRFKITHPTSAMNAKKRRVNG